MSGRPSRRRARSAGGARPPERDELLAVLRDVLRETHPAPHFHAEAAAVTGRQFMQWIAGAAGLGVLALVGWLVATALSTPQRLSLVEAQLATHAQILERVTRLLEEPRFTAGDFKAQIAPIDARLERLAEEVRELRRGAD